MTKKQMAEKIAALEAERNRLVSFIQVIAEELTDDDEIIDFITNNVEDVLEDENGEDLYPRIPYLLN